jgi:hypothetical protein
LDRCPMFRNLFPLLPFALAVVAPVIAAFAPASEPIPMKVDHGFLQALKDRPVAGAWVESKYG